MKQWLSYAQAAALLGVTSRTVKHWTTRPVARDALGVVRHGRQWRIPRPDDETKWEMHTRRRLKSAGVSLKPVWELQLEKLGKQSDRYLVESYRLWLAAYVKALEQGRVTQTARENMLLLWKTACEILDPPTPLRRYEMDVKKLKSHFPPKLRERDLPVKTIMHYWPSERHFRPLRAAHTLADLEKIRRELDFWQAYRDEFRRGRSREPTVENLCRLLHKDLMTHINDTRDKPPDGFTIVNNPEPEEMHMMTLASVQDQSQRKLPPRILVNFRQPQNGISLRTFRTRYPRARRQPIIAKVRRILSTPPGVDDAPQRGPDT